MKHLLKRYILFLFCILPVVLTKCASGSPSCIDIVPPKVQLTGEKTVVERQIIGDYRELEADAWVVSSVQTSMQREASTTSGDKELFDAMKIREFHQDKIRKYKDEAVIGEGANGLVYYRKLQRYERNKDLKNILITVLKEENNARKIIFSRSLVLSGKEKPTDQEIKYFAEQFAKEQIALAKKNDWIQNTSGSWVRKK